LEEHSHVQYGSEYRALPVLVGDKTKATQVMQAGKGSLIGLHRLKAINDGEILMNKFDAFTQLPAFSKLTELAGEDGES